MTVQTTTGTVATDNGSPPETETGTDSTNTGTDSEKETGAATDGESTEEGRLKFLRSKLDEATKKLKAFEVADEERRRADMSESEKLKADLEAARAENAELRRKTIAAENGLDDELAARLRGDTPEELAEDAKRLAALIGKRKPTAPPAKDVGLGGTVGDGDVPTDPIALHRKWSGKS